MDHIRRNDRMAVLTQMLAASPNKIHTLSHFCEVFNTAKSTMSEDISILQSTFEEFGIGKLETVTGAAGGVRYRPVISAQKALDFINNLCLELQTSNRLLPGGFLYLSDVLSTPEIVQTMGTIIAGEFYDAQPDFVLTMETKGIPVAIMTAQALGTPLVIARHSSKVYEGSAVNINYVSASGRIETMSLSRRAIKEGQKALIVDDFLRAGGTAKGMMDLMKEFDVDVVGSAFVMSKVSDNKLIDGEKALMLLDTTADGASITPAPWLEEKAKSEK